MVYNATYVASDIASASAQGVVSLLDLFVGLATFIALIILFKIFTGKGMW